MKKLYNLVIRPGIIYFPMLGDGVQEEVKSSLEFGYLFFTKEYSYLWRIIVLG